MKYQPGDKVTVNAKRYDNEPGTVVSQSDEFTRLYLVTLDKYRDDRTYRETEFGPFAESELTPNTRNTP